MTAYSYSDKFDPPAPALTIDISSTSSPTGITVLAQIDTGSDITVIPAWMAQDLNLERSAVGHFTSVGGSIEASTLYSALVSLEKEEPTRLNVLTWREDFALLGRDAINHWKLFLDGPNRTMTISR